MLRIPLRVAVTPDRSVDLLAEVDPCATVGELADAVASATGAPAGGSLRTSWPGEPQAPTRAERVADAGPRAGSTAHVDPESADDTTDSIPLPSPVVLVGVHGARRRAGYGATPLGRSWLIVSDRVEVRAGPGSSIRVDGEAALGHAVLDDGSLLVVDDQSWSVHIDGALDPPAEVGPWRQHRAVVGAAVVPATTCPAPEDRQTFELPQAPGSVRMPGLPVLTAAVPLLMGAVLWAATRSATAALFVLFSFVFVVAAGIEARREAAAEDRFRVAEFFADLDDIREQLDDDAGRQRQAVDATSPAASELVGWLSGDEADRRIWRRSRDPRRRPSSVVRLGDGAVGRLSRVVNPGGGRRTLRRVVDQLAEESATVEAGVTLDLACTGGIALIGSGDRPDAVARAIVAQLCAGIGPDALRLVALVGAPRRPRWQWASWLPHTTGIDPGALCVVVVDDDHVGELDISDDALLIWMGTSATASPPAIGAVLDVETQRLTLRSTRHLCGHHDDAELSLDRVDDLSIDEAEPAARALCGLRPESNGPVIDDAPPEFTDVLVRPGLLDDADAVVEQWTTAPNRHLLAPIGVTESRGVVNLDLVEDGPHALVAGTTGSGKSELLRTLLVSLALHHPPDRLAFLLIDYKGGAAFRSIESLPHCVGLVTDLAPDVAHRALVSLGAEVRRRERWLADNGLDDLRDVGDDGSPGCPAAMVIVVDEFATMAREIPDFVDGLVDIAQRGRSLGIHLVLATQRPAGVVTDAIRANTSIRIALRVTDEDDSRDVIDTAEAATLPREHPGRAVVRLDHGRTTTIQVAHTGACRSALDRIRLLPLLADSSHLGGLELRGPTAQGGPSALTSAIDTITLAANRSGRGTSRRPWAPPLPDRLVLDRGEPLDAPRSELGVDSIAFGVVDLPDEQRHGLLGFDPPQHRGISVIGCSGTGRSTTLASVITALRRVHPAAVAYVVSVDDLLCESATDGHGDAMRLDDVERIRRMLRVVELELERRRTGTGQTADPPWLVAIDGYAAFEEIHDRVDRGAAVDAVARITRDGPSFGVHVALSANRRAEIGPAVAAGLGLEVLLGAEEDAPVRPGQPGGLLPGRGSVAGALVQIALPGPVTAGRAPSPLDEHRIHRTPTQVRQADLSGIASNDGEQTLLVAVGIDADSLSPVQLDLTHHHAFVTGLPRSGRTTTVRAIADRCAGQGWRTRSIDLDVPPQDRASRISTLIDRSDSATPSLLVLDDLPLLLDADLDGELEPLLALAMDRGRSSPLRVLAAGDGAALLTCYSDVVRRMRSGRTGIALGVTDDAGPDVLHSSTPQRSDIPDAAGRGWLINRGAPTLIQAAR